MSRMLENEFIDKRLKCNQCKKSKIFKLILRKDKMGLLFVVVCNKCGGEALKSRLPNKQPSVIQRAAPMNVISRSTEQLLKTKKEEPVLNAEKVL